MRPRKATRDGYGEHSDVGGGGRSETERRAKKLRGEGAWPRPRDLLVLRWACDQYGARIDHVAALIERSEEAAG